MTDYTRFLLSKRMLATNAGRVVDESAISPVLYDFQRDICQWALKRGRAAVFADCGLGKTPLQLEWARHVGGTVLILAPLCVAEQTIAQGRGLLGLDVKLVRNADDLRPGINITNYEMLRHFIGAPLDGLVLDESSILKSMDGKTRGLLLESFTSIPWRLCCTATPCPNDIAELANHAEFLGVMKRVEMLAAFFVHDDQGWRLRGHAREPFFRWLASWAMSLKSPVDLGYDDARFKLPPLEILDMTVRPTVPVHTGALFGGLKGIGDRSRVRQATVPDRINKTLELIHESWISASISENGKSEMPSMSVNIGSEPKLVEMPDEKSFITQIQSRSKRRRSNSNVAIRPDERITSSKSSMELPSKRPDCSLSSKATDVQFAESQESSIAADLSSTTIIEMDRYVESSVTIAITQSESSKTIPSFSEKPPIISKRQQWIVWCGLNSEQDQLAKCLGIECVSISGRTSKEEKVRLEREWREGRVPVMVTKLKVFGYGMNWQCCANIIFLGLGDSYEQYYQAIRRSWRYGQKAASVKAYIVVSTHEMEIVDNVKRKERESDSLSREIVAAAQRYEMDELGKKHQAVEIMARASFDGPDWRLEQGDCIETLRAEPADSVDLSVFSPPFASLYTYSASEHDLGNSKNHDEFFEHFGFVIDELLRVTKPGRNAAVHIAQSPTTLVNDGLIGLKDLRGRAVEEFCKRGWVYHGEVVIDKDPQAQAIRTHAKGLLFVQLKKDASWLRPALADYILVFRKPGDNVVPIIPDITNEEWIEFARPIWYGIKESDTLNAAEARENQDDRHICPLQLGTIERCIRLWSNKGETILSPFAGIGSEGYVALQQGRQFLGCELKPRYVEVARRNLKQALMTRKQQGLFDEVG